MPYRYPLGLADLLRACKRLGVTAPDECAGIATALGLSFESGAKVRTPDRRRSSEFIEQAPPAPPGPGPASSEAAEAPREEFDFAMDTVVEPGTRQAGIPQFVLDADPMPADPAPVARPPLQSLFAPRLSRNVLRQSLSLPFADGPPDVVALVEHLSDGRPLRELPRAMRLSLRLGVQVLCDVSEAMLPFARDQELLIDQLKELVGASVVEVVYFDGFPDLQELEESEEASVLYVPPAPRTPVLVLSDLGIGRPPHAMRLGGAAEWEAFALRLREQGSPVIAYVPYRPARWPRALRGLIEIHNWDRPRYPAARRYAAPGAAPGEEEALAILQRLEQRDPAAVELARVLSPAARVEPELVRAARIELLPDADAGAEAELAFSRLVQAYTSEAIVLEPSVLDRLRRELAADFPLLRRTKEFLEGYRRSQATPETTLLEERINFLALEGQLSTGRLEEVVAPALKSLLRPGADNVGLAYWALQAVDRLPAEARQARVVRELGLAARLRVSRRAVEVDEMPGDPHSTQWLLPQDLASVPVSIRWTEDGLRFLDGSLEGAADVYLPDTRPRILLVETEQHAGTPVRYALETDGFVDVPAGGNAVTVRAIDGATYELKRRPTPSVALPDGIGEAVIGLETLGGTGSRVTGFALEERLAVTAADHFRGIPFLNADPANVQVRVLNQDAEGDVLVLEPLVAEDYRFRRHLPLSEERDVDSAGETVTPRRVFISHARGDDDGFIRRLYDDLTQRGSDVWWGQERISAGAEFTRTIQEAIGSSDLVLLVLTPEAVKSEPVRAQWQHALKIGKRVIPVLRAGDYDLLPPELASYHALDFREQHPYDDALAELAAALQKPATRRAAVVVFAGGQRRVFSGDLRPLEVPGKYSMAMERQVGSRLLGAPVIVAAQVIGIVTGVSEAETAEQAAAQVLTVTAAGEIRRTLERAQSRVTGEASGWLSTLQARVGHLLGLYEQEGAAGRVDPEQRSRLEDMLRELQGMAASEADIGRERALAALEALEEEMRPLRQAHEAHEQIRQRLEAHALWVESGGARGARANLGDIALENLELEGARLEEAVLDGARLPNAHLQGARLKGASLSGTDLSGTDLTSADLAEARLEKTNLEGANLTGADLQRARLEGANLRGAVLEDAVLESAELAQADLRNANLSGADLRLATLTDVAVAGADLSGADLSQASLDEIDLRRARLEGARLGGVALKRVRLSEEQQKLFEAAPLVEFDVYVSHTDQDAERIQPVLKLLSEAGYSVFADHSALGLKEPLSERWKRMLQRARCILVCLTGAAIVSEWQPPGTEMGMASRRGVLVILMLDELPVSSEVLASGPVIELVDWRGEPDHPGLRHVLEAVASITGKTPSGTAEAGPTEDEARVEAPDLEPGTIYRDRLADGSEGPELVVIPAGEFWMGSDKARDPAALASEFPRHRVTITRPFALGRYPVTFAEYDSFAGTTGRDLPGDDEWGRENRPVIRVSWEDAVAYCAWLSEQTGRRYRLPTEAEWEYAARAGTETRYWWGDEVGRDNANCDGCGSEGENKRTAPVGSFRPNPWSVHDMLGNVWEWVQDCRHDTYEKAPADGLAWEEGDCSQRVIRGGSWLNFPGALRSATRNWDGADKGNYNVGFRLAQDLVPSPFDLSPSAGVQGAEPPAGKARVVTPRTGRASRRRR